MEGSLHQTTAKTTKSQIILKFNYFLELQITKKLIRKTNEDVNSFVSGRSIRWSAYQIDFILKKKGELKEE